MKLSEQYKHHIQKLNEATSKEVVKTKNEESVWSWMLPKFDMFDPFDWLKWGALIGLSAWQLRKLKFAIFGKTSGKNTREGWLQRARGFRAMKKLEGVDRHVSESAYRHMLNMILQKDTHTMADIVNKVKSGKMTADVGYNTAIERFTSLSSVQRADLLKDFKQMEAKLHPPVPTTSSVTNPYWTSTSAGTQKTTSKPTGAELLARTRSNRK